MKSSVSEFVENPQWASFIPPAPPVRTTRHLPAHEDCSPVDVDAIQTHLRVGGTLGCMKGYEERPGQIDMAGAIAAAFNAREHVMIEAGTGVGKSLAYLVPAIQWAWTNDTPVVISTATRNLQSQLMDSDIPRAVGILGEHAKDFRIALLKGRANYLCLKTVDEYFAGGYWTLPTEEQALVEGFVDWVRGTADGDLDTYEGLSREHLSRPGDECTGRHCPYFKHCFVYKARQRAAEAHLIVANHSLVLADAAQAGAGILPAYGRLVFDEAHNLEEIATEQLGHEFSLPALTRVARLVNRSYPEASPLMAKVLRAAISYLSFLGEVIPLEKDLIRYQAARVYWKDVETLRRLQGCFEAQLMELVNVLKAAAEKIENIDTTLKISSAANQLVSIVNEAAFVVKGEREDHAYWAEWARAPKRRPYLRLVAAPLSVAQPLKELFYDLKDSVVLSSATLRVGPDFNYMARRLGCSERFQFLTATSPFDYFRQSLVLAPDCLPDPASAPGDYVEKLADLLKDLLSETEGRALVLFTSYEMMKAVAARVGAAFAEANLQLLVQGEGLSRESMTRALKEGSRRVLFGAQSFWEGVDVAGEALSCVVITRLPFNPVGDPMVEARCEQIDREKNASSFREYMLPEAVIRFRQGFGRLIRTKSDRGVVVITDPRIVTKNYGATFCRSIPSTVHTVTDLSDLIDWVRSFLMESEGRYLV